MCGLWGRLRSAVRHIVYGMCTLMNVVLSAAGGTRTGMWEMLLLVTRGNAHYGAMAIVGSSGDASRRSWPYILGVKICVRPASALLDQCDWMCRGSLPSRALVAACSKHRVGCCAGRARLGARILLEQQDDDFVFSLPPDTVSDATLRAITYTRPWRHREVLSSHSTSTIGASSTAVRPP